jgi:alpha-tubulin suppressor-like RCC1 family protein
MKKFQWLLSLVLAGPTACGVTDSIIGAQRAPKDAGSDAEDASAAFVDAPDPSKDEPLAPDAAVLPDAPENTDLPDASAAPDTSDVDADPPPDAATGSKQPHMVAAGTTHTCAMRPDRTVACWGDNRYGQLGDGTEWCHWMPRTVEGLSDVVEVAAGFAHTCARLSDETVWCWGNNESGQLGDGTQGGFRTRPVLVRDLSGVREFALGRSHSCARLSDGTVNCWGTNDQGELLGELPIGTASPTAVPLKALSGVEEIVADKTGGQASGMTCVRLSDGSVRCWGSGSCMFDWCPEASKVPDLSDATQIATRTDGLCALAPDGAVKCYQFSYGLPSPGRPSPVNVIHFDGVSGITEIAVTGTSTWLMHDGTVSTYNSVTGQFASGPQFGVPEISGVVELVAGFDHACARTADSRLTCWGSSATGALGNNYGDHSHDLVQVPAVTSVVGIAAGSSYACAVMEGGTVKCWGNSRAWIDYFAYRGLGGASAHDIGGLTNAVEVALSDRHACARVFDGHVRCWGSNEAGQLGDGNPRPGNDAPDSEVLGIDEAVQVALGGRTSCARLRNGTVRCWGANGVGLGDGNPVPSSDPPQTFSSSVPVVVAGISTATDLAVSGSHACVSLVDGSVWCWGLNDQQQLGDGTTISRPTPVRVQEVAGATSVSVTPGSSCAGLNDGTAKCWGQRLTTELHDLRSVVKVKSGYSFSCALRKDGTVSCWGVGRYGQVQATGHGFSSEPIAVPDASNVVEIALGDEFGCARLADGIVKCWGDNGFGQLGLGVTSGPGVIGWP